MGRWVWLTLLAEAHGGMGQARALELCAAMGLAHLRQCQSKRAVAYELLAPIYDWFTAGFDTADLLSLKRSHRVWTGNAMHACRN